MTIKKACILLLLSQPEPDLKRYLADFDDSDALSQPVEDGSRPSRQRIIFFGTRFGGIHPSEFRALSLANPVWIVGVLGFTFVGYTLRCVRWTRMMRSTGARFSVCARVLMTSLAANNIMPFRIGDIMRIFTYAPDLGTSPSVHLQYGDSGKVTGCLCGGTDLCPHHGDGSSCEYSPGGADAALIVSTMGLLTLVMFGASRLEGPARTSRLPKNKLVRKDRALVPSGDQYTSSDGSCRKYRSSHPKFHHLGL